MRTEMTDNQAPPVRGFAWHIFADPATPGVFAGDTPFGSEDAPGLARQDPPRPPGVLHFWVTPPTAPGLQNRAQGNAYLVLTEGPDAPPVARGWNVEAARLDESFQLEQRGDRWVRMLRILGTHKTPWGEVQECELEVDRT